MFAGWDPVIKQISVAENLCFLFFQKAFSNWNDNKKNTQLETLPKSVQHDRGSGWPHCMRAMTLCHYHTGGDDLTGLFLLCVCVSESLLGDKWAHGNQAIPISGPIRWWRWYLLSGGLSSPCKDGALWGGCKSHWGGGESGAAFQHHLCRSCRTGLPPAMAPS